MSEFKRPILFYIIWILSILIIIATLISKCEVIEDNRRFILLLLLIGILFLPFLSSLSIGNLFRIDLRKIGESIDKLRETVLNVLQSNVQNKQEVNIFPLKTPDDRSEQIRIELRSQRYAEQAYSLFKQGRILESIEFYHKSFEWDNNNWVAAFFLGFLYLSLNDYKIPDEKLGIDKLERLSRSVFYSSIATINDPNHYMQFMNLGIAQGHWGESRMLTLALRNLEKAYNMLDYDPNVKNAPKLFLNKGKCRSFMGEFSESLGDKDNARRYRKEAIDILKSCPQPVPKDRDRWLKQAEDALQRLT